MDLLIPIGAYILGSIPFAYVLVRVFVGVDVRKIGSGNAGATNASRAFRPPWQIPMFLFIYLLDFAKGFVPAWWAGQHYAGPDSEMAPMSAVVLVGAAAILGHCTSPFLKFRGGKGVATTTGVFAWLSPIVLGVALVMFFVVRFVTREVFLGSLAIGVTLAVGVVLEDPPEAFSSRWPLTVFALVIAGFLFYTHRSNIKNYRINGSDEDDPAKVSRRERSDEDERASTAGRGQPGEKD